VHVLLINSLYPPHLVGGAERSVAELAADLTAEGARVTVLSLSPEGAGAQDQGGVRVRTVPVANLGWPYAPSAALTRKLWHAVDLYNPLMGASVARVIAAERPDVVHTNNLQGFSVAAWAAARRAGVPVAHTLRDHYLSCARSSRCRGATPCARTCLACVPFLAARRRASALVDAAVGLSRHILELHRGLGFFPHATTLRVIHRGPALAAPRAPAPVRPLRLGFLGRIDPVKGVELLIRSLPGGAELHVAGEGAPDYVARLRALPGAARVVWRGPVDGPTFLRELDVLVVPSLWDEPMGRVLLEGLAAGLPVVASRRGGIPELVEDGRSGLLFDPDVPGELARVLGALTRPRLAELAAGALARAQALAREPLGRAYLEVYEAITRR